MATLTIRVRWPKQITTIPVGTSRIEVDAYAGQATTIFGGPSLPARATLLRSPFQSFTTAVLERIPPGLVRVAVVARGAKEEILATGGSLVNVKPNENAQVAVKLESPSERLSLDRITPTNHFPGGIISLQGQGFGFSQNATYSLDLGGRVVSGNAVFRYTDGIMSFLVPANATTSSVTLTVGDRKATAPEVFTAIGSVSLEPTLLVVPRAATAAIAIAVRDTAGATVLGPTLYWTKPLEACTGCLDGDVGRILDAKGTFQAEADLHSGIVVLQLGIPPIAASATVQVIPSL